MPYCPPLIRPRRLLLILLGAMAPLLAVQSATGVSEDAELVHGHWCGPGFRVGQAGQPKPPKDPLDRACMFHDLCYSQRGAHSCACDIVFMRALQALPYSPDSDMGEKGRTFYDVIAAKPCRGPGLMMKWRMGMGAMMGDFMSGQAMPWDIPQRWGETFGGD